MKERPIIITVESVRAILDGRKTQTRRIATPEQFGMSTFAELRDDLGSLWARFSRPRHPRFGERGDLLWVKETWCLYEADKHNPWPDLPSRRGPDGLAFYREGFDRATPPRWRSPLFMPRWASRLMLRVAEVRVQRLQDISEDDARAEGVMPYTPPTGHISPEQRVPGPGFDRCRLGDQPHRFSFADRWDHINGKRRRRELIPLGALGYGRMRTVADESATWEHNPWIWAITFSRVP